MLVVNVDDIVARGNDEKGIRDPKAYHEKEFEIKDLGELKYILRLKLKAPRKKLLSLSASIHWI